MEDESVLDRNERALYLTQINHLEEQLMTFQFFCEELEKKHSELLLQYSKLEKEAKDRTRPLKSSVSVEEKEVDDLYDQLENQKDAARKAKEARQLKRTQQRQEMQKQIDELEAKAATDAVALEEMKKLVPTHQQVSHLETKEKQLADQKETYESIILHLRIEAEAESQNFADGFQNEMESLLEQRVSKVLGKEKAKHQTYLMHLQFLENEVPLSEEELNQLKTGEPEAISRKNTRKKALKEMAQQRFIFEKEENQLRKTHLQLITKRKEHSSNVQCATSENKAVCHRQTCMDEKHRQQVASIEELEVKLQQQRGRRRQLEGGSQEASIILRHILQEADKVSQTRMTQRLIEVLDSLAPQGGQSFSDVSTEKATQSHKPPTSSSKPVR